MCVQFAAVGAASMTQPLQTLNLVALLAVTFHNKWNKNLIIWPSAQQGAYPILTGNTAAMLTNLDTYFKSLEFKRLWCYESIDTCLFLDGLLPIWSCIQVFVFCHRSHKLLTSWMHRIYVMKIAVNNTFRHFRWSISKIEITCDVMVVICICETILVLRLLC